jgi:hypothetical protein
MTKSDPLKEIEDAALTEQPIAHLIEQSHEAEGAYFRREIAKAKLQIFFLSLAVGVLSMVASLLAACAIWHFSP